MTENTLVRFLPFECRLTLVTSRRLNQLPPIKQWFSGEQVAKRDLLVLDFDALSVILKKYFDDYMKAEFENSLYAPFNYVHLSGINRRKTEEVLTKEAQEMAEEMQIIPTQSSNLRKRRGEVFNVSKRYNGVAVFTRDGDLEVPSTNVIQSKQLQAHSDEYNVLLYMLRQSSPETGLDSVASVTLSVDVNTGIPGTNQPTTDANDYDYIIIVAVIVAGCSMVLLAFALYLAFRRRNYAGARPMVQTKLSPRTDTDISPTSDGRSPQPPVQVMEMHPEHDDNISDYTESVFSLPAQTKQQKIKESLAVTTTNDRKHQRISSRFKPRYIISSKKSSDGESDKSSNGDETSFGIPHFPSPVKSKSDSNLNGSKSRSPRSREVEALFKESSGLYPAEIIDDDITSSLSAYGKGIGMQKNFKLQNNDDGVSLSSVESYGFSLDGVGDQSTLANSTKYGY